MEKVITALLEQGPLGLLCVLLLIGYVKRDRQYLELYARTTKHLAEDNLAKREMNRELTGALRDLNEACENCTYRRFVDRVTGGE